jgi:hypothetical protein
MNTHKGVVTHTYIQKHRRELRVSVRATYGLLRIFLVLYGGVIALFYLLSPFTDRVLMPDVFLNILIAILALLSLCEIALRMTEYSCEIYPLSEEKMDEEYGKNKDSFLTRIALRIPFRGIHLYLLALWFFLAFYYLVLCGIGYGEKEITCPENFSLSFYAIAGACVADFISKGIFIFRIPGLGGYVAEFANAIMRTEENTVARIMSGFLKIFQKMSFKKER